MNRGTTLLLAACLFLASGMAAGCRSSPDEQAGGAKPERWSRHQPILLIGLDGVEWDVVLAMLHQDRLPNLARLMEDGTFGELASTIPTKSPIIWTSIATGKTAAKHGIGGFVRPRRDPSSRQELYTSNDRRTKAFWNILTDWGGRVATVGWWMTFPVEEVNGVMVAQVNTSTPQRNQTGKGIWKGSLVPDLPGQVHPPERQAEILACLPQVEAALPALTRRIFGEFASPLTPVGQRLWQACTWAFRADAIYHRVALKLLREDADYDIFAVYFGGSDLAGHRFWRYLHPDLYRVKPARQEIENLSGMIAKYYAYLDEVVGEMVEAASADSVIIVVSDHGMEPTNTAGRFAVEDLTRDLNSGEHHNAPPGFFVACGPNIRKNDIAKPVSNLTREDLPLVGSVFDVLPTMLSLLGLPVARDLDGTVMTEIIAPGYLHEHPVQPVDTYTPPQWYEDRRKSNAGGVGVEERLEQLRALGYIAGPAEEEVPPTSPSTSQDHQENPP